MATVPLSAEVRSAENWDRKFFSVDKKNLQLMWHSATLKGLLKAKARDTYKDVSVADRVVFEECSRDAVNAGELAICVSKLLNERDLRRTMAEQMERMQKKVPPDRINGTKSFPESITEKPIIYRSDEIVRETSKAQPPSIWATNYKTMWRRIEKMPHHPTYRQPYSNTHPHFNSRKKSIERFRNVIRPQRKTYEVYFRNKQHRRSKRDDCSAKMERLAEDLNKLTLSEENWRKRRKRDIPNMNTSVGKDIFHRFGSAASNYLNSFMDSELGPTEQSKNIENLKLIGDHFKRVDIVNSYFALVVEENKKLFESLKLPLETTHPTINSNKDGLNEVLDTINEFLGGKAKSKFSFLSPRLLSVIPEKNGANAAKKRLLSPTLLSFHKDGLLSVQDLLKSVTTDSSAHLSLLDMVMDVSGAGISLQQIVDKMHTEIKNMKDVQYPLVKEMCLVDLAQVRARKTYSAKQHEEFSKKGYTFLNEAQLNQMYSVGSRMMEKPKELEAYIQLSEKEKEELLEKEIRELAKLYKTSQQNKTVGLGRAKRQAEPEPEPAPNNEPKVHFLTLHPLAFGNIVGLGHSMTVITLSPHAFISEILSPEALLVDTLSPRAFIATILSPSALMARVLSPTAFRAEVLSPSALTAWVLSPEVFLVEVLTPKFLVPRVLSPETLIIEILGPEILSPHILSGESLGVLVLSPRILSPRIESEEKFLVEILSPHILGGPHSKEEEEEHGVIADLHSGESHHGIHGEPKEGGGGDHEGHDHELDPLDLLAHGDIFAPMGSTPNPLFPFQLPHLRAH